LSPCESGDDIPPPCWWCRSVAGWRQYTVTCNQNLP